MKLSGVYQITNLANGKIYIGSSVNIQKRFIKHRSELNTNKHSNYHLQNSWNLYGAGCFKFEVLAETLEDIESLEHLVMEEKANLGYILYNIQQPSKDYNYILSEETKRRLSESGKNVAKPRWSQDAKDAKSESLKAIWESGHFSNRKKRSEPYKSIKLKEKDRIDVVMLYNEGNITTESIAEKFNISAQTVRNIVKRQGINKKVGRKPRIMTPENLELLDGLLEEGSLNYSEISKIFNVSPSHISKLATKRSKNQ